MLKSDNNKNAQNKTDAVKVDASTFLNEKFQNLENRMVDTLQITSRQSSKIFEKMNALMNETHQLSANFNQQAPANLNEKFQNLEDRLVNTLHITSRQSSKIFEKITALINATPQIAGNFDKKAFDDAIAQLQNQIAAVQDENQENVNHILGYLDRMSTLLGMQGERTIHPVNDNAVNENTDTASTFDNLDALNTLYDKFYEMEGRITEVLYLTSTRTALLLDKMDEMLSNKKAEEIQPEHLKAVMQDIDDTQQAIAKEQQQYRIFTDNSNRDILESMNAAIQELCRGLDYDMLANKIVEKMPQQAEAIAPSFTYLPTGIAPVEATVDYELLTEKITENLPNFASEYANLEDKIIELLNNYLPTMASNFINYDILVDKIVEKLPVSEPTVLMHENIQPTTHEVTVEFDQEKFTDRVLTQLGDLTESIINYDLLAQKLAENQPTTPIVVENRDSVTPIDETSLANKVVELLPEFINYRVLSNVIEENIKLLENNLQENQQEIINLLKEEKPIEIPATAMSEIATTAVDTDGITNSIIERLNEICKDLFANSVAKIEQPCKFQLNEELLIKDTTLLGATMPEVAWNSLKYNLFAEKIIDKINRSASNIEKSAFVKTDNSAESLSDVQLNIDFVAQILNKELPDMIKMALHYEHFCTLIVQYINHYAKVCPELFIHSVENEEQLESGITVNEELYVNTLVDAIPTLLFKALNYDAIDYKIEKIIKYINKSSKYGEPVFVNSANSEEKVQNVKLKVKELVEELHNELESLMRECFNKSFIAEQLQESVQHINNYNALTISILADNFNDRMGGARRSVDIVEHNSIDEDQLVTTLLQEIPAMMEATLNYDLIAEKVAQYINIPEISEQNITPAVAEIDYDTLVERLAERMPTPEMPTVTVDYDTLAEKVVEVMPEIEVPAPAEIDYDTLVERLAERMPTPEVPTVIVDYDTLAEKVVEVMPEIEVPAPAEIDYDTLVERLAERMPTPEVPTVTVDYDTLAEKVVEVMPEIEVPAPAEIDYDMLADKVAARMPMPTVAQEEIDYDRLAEKVAMQLKDEIVLPEIASVDASALDVANIATTIASHLDMQNKADNLSDELLEKFNQVNDKIDRVQDNVNLIFNAYKLPEMTRLDKNIAIYNQNKEEENLVAVLLSANTLLAIADNYVANGSQEEGQQILNVVYNKLNAIKIHGASKIQFVLDTLTNYGMEKCYAEDALTAFMDAVAAFNATHTRFDSALANSVIDTKFELLQDVTQNKLDKSIYNELENVANSHNPDKDSMLLSLKDELIAMPLSVFVNSNTPTSYVEVSEDISLPIDELVEAIYDRLHNSISAPKTERKAIHAKKRKVLRPAITKRGNMDTFSAEDAVLKIVHRKIDTEKNTQSLFAMLEDDIQSK